MLTSATYSQRTLWFLFLSPPDAKAAGDLLSEPHLRFRASA